MLVPLVSTGKRREPLGIRLFEHPTVTLGGIILAARGNTAAPVEGDVNPNCEPINIQGWWNLGIDKAVRPRTAAVSVCSDDLDIRARRRHTDPVSVDAEFTHEHPGQHTGALDKWLELVDADTRTYETKYSRPLWLTHMYKRFLSRSGRKTKDSMAT